MNNFRKLHLMTRLDKFNQDNDFSSNFLHIFSKLTFNAIKYTDSMLEVGPNFVKFYDFPFFFLLLRLGFMVFTWKFVLNWTELAEKAEIRTKGLSTEHNTVQYTLKNLNLFRILHRKIYRNTSNFSNGPAWLLTSSPTQYNVRYQFINNLLSDKCVFNQWYYNLIYLIYRFEFVFRWFN